MNRPDRPVTNSSASPTEHPQDVGPHGPQRGAAYQLKSAAIFLAVWLIPTQLVLDAEWGGNWAVAVTAGAFVAAVYVANGMDSKR
ncbi:MAG: hypothetical protein NXI30_04080 [bacterium]|nr:hypothetical protein [bacterium]